MNYKKLALTVAAGAMATTMMAQSAPKLNANNIDEVIKAMTLEEKAQMLVARWQRWIRGQWRYARTSEEVRAGCCGYYCSHPSSRHSYYRSV